MEKAGGWVHQGWYFSHYHGLKGLTRLKGHGRNCRTGKLCQRAGCLVLSHGFRDHGRVNGGGGGGRSH